MYNKGDHVYIKNDKSWAYIYDCFKDRNLTPYYQVVWFEEDLHDPPNDLTRMTYWEDELVIPKTRILKNGNKIILSK